MNPGNIPRLNEIAVDSRVLAVTFGLSLLTGVVFGLIPAIQASRTDLQDSLKKGGKTSGSGSHGHWLRNGLVVAEIAMALVLLIGAGLLFSSFLRLRETRAGFDPANVLTVDVSLPAAKYAEPHLQTGFFRDLLARVRTLPGVRQAGAITALPLAGPGSATSFFIEGAPAPAPGQAPVADVRAVTPDFFQSMGIALKRGRVVTDRDSAGAPLVVVINESMVNTFWPNEDPIGKRINMPWGEPMIGEIVGIVDDVRLTSLDTIPRATLYWPYQQFPFAFMTLVVRTAGEEPKGLIPAIRMEVSSLDKEQPIASVRTMEEVIAASVARPRFNSSLLAIFAAVALILASVGIYGVMSFSVTQRTREIGIRMAMGARSSNVLSMVVGQGMMLAAAGVALGIVGSLALTRAMAGLLYEIKPTDLPTYTLVSLALLAVAFIANYIPARRATRIDPLNALRHE